MKSIDIFERAKRSIVTAAHCLPFFPPAMSFSDISDRTFKNLVGSIEGEERAVWAECSFVDPIADIAILAPPDSQDLWEQCEGYEKLVDACLPIAVGSAAAVTEAWLLSLSGKWGHCKLGHAGGPPWVTDAADGLHGGMSGSPIVDCDGNAIGVFCTSGLGSVGEDLHTSGGPQPRLDRNLPACPSIRRRVPSSRSEVRTHSCSGLGDAFLASSFQIYG
jgi:hypothetical protein